MCCFHRSALMASVLLCLSFDPTLAVEIFYDFEGPETDVVFDKRVTDGTQNGQIHQNVDPDDTFVPAFGSESAFFDLPNPGITVPPYSTLEIPDSTLGTDFSLTLAAFIRNDEVPQNFTRAFSSYRGTGGVTNERILLDFDSRVGGTVPGIRAIVGNTVVATTAPPEGMADPGYHHYALTVDAGNVKIFFNGNEVASGLVPAGYSNLLNIRIGEDPHDGGGAAAEQLIGNIDDVLMINRALSPTDIASLASGMTVSSVVTPLDSERAVYYDFEGDSGTTVTDKFTLDGSQNGVAHERAVVVSDNAQARLGDGSFNLQDPRVDNPPVPFSQIIAGPLGRMGPEFTFSAVVNPLAGGQLGNGLARVFSTYAGTGGTAGRFIIDVNPNAAEGGIGTRIILPDGTVLTTDTAPALTQNSTLTAVYNYGEVTLFLDGAEIATTTVDAKSINFGNFDLRIGEDGGGAVNENFVGNMDDVLVLRRALSAEQVVALHNSGAAALLQTLSPAVLSGDYNDDGVVDAADYVVWRNNQGTSTVLPNDRTPGSVDVDDYTTWKLNYGLASLTLGSEAAISRAVPAPGTMGLGGLMVVAIAALARRRR